MSVRHQAPLVIERGDLAMLRAIRDAAESGIAVVRPAESLPGEGEPPAHELILNEIMGIVTAKHPAIGIDLLRDAGLAERLLPEVDALRDMTTAAARHKDVYRHTLLVVARTPPDTTLRLAALFHDIGKPDTKTVEDGVVHFPGHAEVGAEMTRRRLRRLGADPALTQAVTLLVALHLRANSYEPDWTDSAVRRLDRDAGDQIDRLLALSRADVTSARRDAVQRALRRVDALEARIAAVRAADVRPISPLTGHDLMAIFDRPPGPWIGVIKSRLEALVATGDLAPGDAAAAEQIARNLMSERDQS
ncbi:MAG: HDIG domain-containing metalloprotein [Dehalococcoidia bacterium]